MREVVSETQNKLLENIDSLISSRLQNFQKSVTETQRQLSENQLAKMEEMTTDTYTFKRKGNEEQHKVNVKAINKMKEASSALTENPTDNEHTTLAKQRISEGIEILNHRQKLIKLADQSESGWKTVTEYETHNLADNSEDEKRIMRAETRAARKMKTKKTPRFRSIPYETPQRISTVVTTDDSLPVHRPGKCYECGKPGHWRSDHYTTKRTAEKISTQVGFISDSLHSCNLIQKTLEGTNKPKRANLEKNSTTEIR